MNLLAVATVSSVCAVAAAEVTYQSTWADQSGPAMLASYSGSNDNVTFGYADSGYNDSHGFYVQESPLVSTPNVTMAWIRGLQEGDTVTATIWYKGTITEDGSSKARLWSHYTAGDDINAYAGSSSGNSNTYGGASGEWEMLTNTWTIGGNFDEGEGFAIETRIYSSPATDPDGTAILYGDDLTITVSRDDAIVDLAGVPAPGALALLGLGGIVARRRRA